MNDLQKQFGGITVALYSCFDDSNKVDTEAVAKLVRFYKEKGIRGLYVCGSTGEGLLMSVEERKQTLEAVMNQVTNDMNIIVHVGASATHDACELARHAEEKGAHAVSAIPSVYYRLSEAAIANSWNTMMQASNLPFIIYNIPQLTGYNMTKNLFDIMLQNPKVIGIKNSSECVFHSMQFKKWGGDNFLVFHGMDEHYAAGRMMGADGGIGGTYGVMPELFLALDKLILENKVKEAEKLQVVINEIIVDLVSFPSMYGAAKELLKLRGISIGKARLPFLPVEEKDMPKIEELHKKIMKAVASVC